MNWIGTCVKQKVIVSIWDMRMPVESRDIDAFKSNSDSFWLEVLQWCCHLCDAHANPARNRGVQGLCGGRLCDRRRGTLRRQRFHSTSSKCKFVEPRKILIPPNESLINSDFYSLDKSISDGDSDSMRNNTNSNNNNKRQAIAEIPRGEWPSTNRP